MESKGTQLYTLALGLDIKGRPFTPEQRDEAIQRVAARFDAFTLVRASGYWRGHPEDTFRFEIIAGSGAAFSIRELARELAEAFDQESVLVTQNRTHATLIAQDVDKDYNL